MFKTFTSKASAKKIAAIAAGAVTLTGVSLSVAVNGDLLAADHGCHPAHYPWYHKGLLHTYDHASVRRGYEVYKQVCAACHSLDHTYYRQLVGVTHTEEEAKAEAAEAMVKDGPNEDGEMYDRPGKLSDRFPAPYANEELAKKANNGAAPPDLSLITLARNGGEDYVFSILTGYCDAPAGVEAKEGLHYNPYFNGGWINMAKALYDDVIEYSDGTPATTSQLAKDVVTFLAWSSEKSLDEKKKILLKALLYIPPIIAFLYVYKRRVFSVIKSRKIEYHAPKNTSKGAKH